jgi:hypothetical protein
MPVISYASVFRSTAEESVTPLWIGMRDSMYMRLVSIVPEPSSAMLLTLGGLLILVRLMRTSRR